MAAAAPRLAELQQVRTPWWEILGAWWKPIAGATVFATAGLVLLLAISDSAPGTRPSATLALSAVVGQGDPAVIWAGLGEDVDPVLALIVLEGETP